MDKIDYLKNKYKRKVNEDELKEEIERLDNIDGGLMSKGSINAKQIGRHDSKVWLTNIPKGAQGVQGDKGLSKLNKLKNGEGKC